MLLTISSHERFLKHVFAIMLMKYTCSNFLAAVLFEDETAVKIYSYLYTIDRKVFQLLLESFTPYMSVGVEDGEVILEKINNYLFKLNDVHYMIKSKDPSSRAVAIDVCDRLDKTDGPMFIQQAYNENDLRSKYFWNDTHITYLHRIFNITKELWKKIKLKQLAAKNQLDLTKKLV